MQTGMTEKNQEKSLMSINKVLCPQNISSSMIKKLYNAVAFVPFDA